MEICCTGSSHWHASFAYIDSLGAVVVGSWNMNDQCILRSAPDEMKHDWKKREMKRKKGAAFWIQTNALHSHLAHACIPFGWKFSLSTHAPNQYTAKTYPFLCSPSIAHKTLCHYFHAGTIEFHIICYKSNLTLVSYCEIRDICICSITLAVMCKTCANGISCKWTWMRHFAALHVVCENSMRTFRSPINKRSQQLKLQKLHIHMYTSSNRVRFGRRHSNAWIWNRAKEKKIKLKTITTTTNTNSNRFHLPVCRYVLQSPSLPSSSSCACVCVNVCVLKRPLFVRQQYVYAFYICTAFISAHCINEMNMYVCMHVCM